MALCASVSQSDEDISYNVPRIGYVTLAEVSDRISIVAHYLLVKSLQFILSRVSFDDLKTSCTDLTTWKGTTGALTSVARGPFYWQGLTLIPALISNYTHYNVWDEITYPFLNFNGATVEV